MPTTALSMSIQSICEGWDDYSPVAAALALGGDGRIRIEPVTGRNSYGCLAWPDPDSVRFGSTTASTIGPVGFDAAAALYARLISTSSGQVNVGLAGIAAQRIRRELLDLSGASPNKGVEVVLAASGTDAHLIFGQLVLGLPGAPWVIIMPDPAESGSGVPMALAGRHFADGAALGYTPRKGAPVSSRAPAVLLQYALREPTGAARSPLAIDREIEGAIRDAAASGYRALVVAVDVSKTGISAPGPGSISSWKRRYGDAVEIVVDACQFRLSTERLSQYLEIGCSMAVTGSKFMGGPIFSGALFVPPQLAARLQTVTAPEALRSYSARHDWPEHWRATETLDQAVNAGLLLRWEAALAEMRRYRAVPGDRARAIINDFRRTFISAIDGIPAIELIPEARRDTEWDGIDPAWDATIFPFFVRLRDGPARRYATAQEARHIYRRLAGSEGTSSVRGARFELGQPVTISPGRSALRLSLSAPLIADAYVRRDGYLRTLASNAVAAISELT